jgi:hypothetical protein
MNEFLAKKISGIKNRRKIGEKNVTIILLGKFSGAKFHLHHM